MIMIVFVCNLSFVGHLRFDFLFHLWREKLFLLLDVIRSVTHGGGIYIYIPLGFNKESLSQTKQMALKL